MSGLAPDTWRQRFAECDAILTWEDYDVVNPARSIIARHTWLYRIVGYRLTLLYDLWLLTRCDLIYKIIGWQLSRGSNIESCVAYYFKIWPVPKHDTAKVDKKLAKLLKKYGITT